jgi:hypothetical protein
MPATTAAAPAPVLALSGYTQVAASNATFLPASGATLTANNANNITATSSTKTITEFLLLQIVTDPSDTPLLYATQSPFSIPFTPTRVGSTGFGAIAVFNDNTYAMATLTYTLQATGTLLGINLVNVPQSNMVVGDSRVIQASAVYLGGSVDVTNLATYSAQSGGSAVLGIGTGGTISANGSGVDTLDVSYGGLSASAAISVGACSYVLGPANQIVPYTGGTVNLVVTAPAGCAWAATGGSSWLAFASFKGSGNGSIALTAVANSSGSTQVAAVMLGGVSATFTQPATACTYGLSTTHISAPAAGMNGNITVSTSCPLVVSSNATWASPYNLGSSVDYTIATNTTMSVRSGTITIGNQIVTVNQTGATPSSACDVQHNGNINVADVQLIINEALGVAPAVNNLSGDGVVNVVDVLIEINATLGLGCSAT